MKKKIQILILCGIGVLGGCGFLDEEPQSGQPEEKVITSATALFNQAVLALYDHIGGTADGYGLQGTYRGIYDLQTFASNEAIIPIRGGDWWDGGLWLDMHAHTWAPDNECCENAWLYLYQLIGLCNHSLGMIDRYSVLMSPEQQTACKAEIRAVRAMCYIYLVDLFARVPIITREDIAIHDIVQSERSEVFGFAWDELRYAETYLASERSNNRGDYYGRITRPVAQFLLMKLALNAEVWTDNDWTDGVRPDGKQIMLECADQTTRNAWDAVVYYGNEILTSPCDYRLCASLTDCFAAYNEEAHENIFTIPMDPSSYRNRFKNLVRSLHYQHAAALGFGGENGSCATLETLEVFGYGTKEQDCRFRENFFAGRVAVNSATLILTNGDTLVYYPNEVKMNLTGSEYVATAGARMRKYAYDPGNTNNGKLSNSDIILFRVADLYLMMAEAKVRNGESGQNEFDIVRLREPLALNTLYKPRQATLENIYYERWIELMWEGWHRQDQIRFGKFEEAAEDNYLTVFPIPQKALHTNGNLRQHKGYE